MSRVRASENAVATALHPLSQRRFSRLRTVIFVD
jgi:hypothetical protein